MNQKLKNIVCALLITAFSAGALAASESASFAASSGKTHKTSVTKKARHRRTKKDGTGNIVQNRKPTKSRKHKTRKTDQAPYPLVPGSADESNA